MDMFTIIWLAVALILFCIFMVDGFNELKLTQAEYAVIAFIICLMWPLDLVIFIAGYPFYLIYKLTHHVDENKPQQDDDEPQGFDYEEYEDECDGNTEYEDDDDED